MKREWAQLNQYYTFTTVQGQSLYPLPSGFGRIINDTIWNITNRLPVPGPLTPEEWSYLKARLVGVTFNVLFRQYQQQIQLFPDTDTPGDWELAYEFTSRNWLQTASASAPDKTEPDANSDVVWFDPTVVTLGCVLRFQQAHKMATAASQDAYDVALQDAMDDDGGAPDLRLDSLGRDLALIGERNIPLTGFGGV
jgi:hypothetical protein